MTQLELFPIPDVLRKMSCRDTAILLRLQGDDDWYGDTCIRCEGPLHTYHPIPIYEEISFEVTRHKEWKRVEAWVSVCSHCYDELNRRKTG